MTIDTQPVHVPIPFICDDPTSTTMSSEANVATSLRTALRMPTLQRWVADWLFSDLQQTPFHKNLPLPPQALQHALALHARHNISIPAALFQPSIPGMPPPSSTKQQAFVTTKLVDLIFVPVATIDTTIVGYALGLSPKNRSSSPDAIPSNPFHTPFAARFAFDTAFHDLLIVTHATSPPVIGMIAMSWTRHKVRDQYTFAVPSEEYSFENLPKTVLSMFSNIEHRFEDLPFSARTMLSRENDHDLPDETENSTAPASFSSASSEEHQHHPQQQQDHSKLQSDPSVLLTQFLDTDLLTPGLPRTIPQTSPQDTNTDLLDTLLASSSPNPSPEQAAWDTLPTPTHNQKPSISHLPWIVSPNGHTSDGLPLSHQASDSTTSSGAFNLSRLEHALGSLGDQLRGRFYGPTVRMDCLHILTGRYTSMYTGKITYAVQPLAYNDAASIKETFAQRFYQAVLAVAPDQRLVVPLQEEAAHAEGHVNRVLTMEDVQQQVTNVLMSDDMERGPLDMVIGAATTKMPVSNAMPHQAQRPAPAQMIGTDATSVRQAPMPVLMPRTTTLTTSSSNPQHSLNRGAVEQPIQIAPATSTEMRMARNEEAAASARKVHEKSETKEERKARMEAERRKRNRLSAARSNLRKKLELEAVRKEIDDNRRRMAKLSEQHRVAAKENEQLRRMVAERAAMAGR